MAIIIVCSSLFTGCSGTSEDKQSEVQPSTEQSISEQTTKSTESVKTESDKMFEFETQELSCRKGDQNIFGQVYIPQTDNNNKMPAVIIGHGFGGTYIKNYRFAETFAQNGIVAYLFDFCGGSPSSQSDGKTTEMSIVTEKEDMLAAFDEVSKLDYVDTDNIFLFGESQGGLVASLCGAELTDKVKGLALLYPAYNIPDIAKETFSDASLVPDEYEMLGMTIGKPYYTDSQSVDVFKEIGKYKGPVQIYHGTSDSMVPYSYSEEAIKVYENAKLIPEEGMEHGFDGELEYSIANDIVEFINANLK